MKRSAEQRGLCMPALTQGKGAELFVKSVLPQYASGGRAGKVPSPTPVQLLGLWGQVVGSLHGEAQPDETERAAAHPQDGLHLKVSVSSLSMSPSRHETGLLPSYPVCAP